MISAIKLWCINHKNIIKISTFTLLSIILLFITWLIDYQGIFLKEYIPEILLLPVEVSIMFLSNLSGVFLTISIFTLTTIITVLNQYSTLFTPRLVQDFIDKANALSLLGVFVGGFFYTVLGLFMLHNVESGNRVISGSIGIIYSVISMIGFIIFAQRILHDVKTTNVIEAVYKDCEALVNKEADVRKQGQRYSHNLESKTFNVEALTTGYLFEVNYKELLKIVGNLKCEIVVIKKIGEYVPKGSTLAIISIIDHNDLEEDDLLAMVKKMGKSFLINFSKNDDVDYHYELIKLSEIAMKALSSGINDPNTAINCINKLALLLGKLFSTGNQSIIVASNDAAKIVYETYSVKEELYLTFSQIIFYSKGEPMVSRAILEGIYLIYMLANGSAKNQVKEYFNHAYESLESCQDNELIKEQLSNIDQEIKQNYMGQLKV